MTSFSLGRFSLNEMPPFLGVVCGEQVTPVEDLGCGFASGILLQDLLQDWDRNFTLLRSAVESGEARGIFSLADLQILAPHPNPPQIFCAGANYRKHVLEMVVAIGVRPDTDGMHETERQAYAETYLARQIASSSPFIFMKPVSTIAGPNDRISLPPYSEKVDWEIELAAVMGRAAFGVGEDDALACVAGYMVVNDVTARDKVFRSEPGAIGADWLSGKGSPGFLPTGPFFVPAAFVDDPHDLGMELTVNGQVMQSDRTSDMVFDIRRQIAFLSRHVAMLSGDLLCTGSPAGNGIVRNIFLRDGDVVTASIDGLGTQQVRFASVNSRG